MRLSQRHLSAIAVLVFVAAVATMALPAVNTAVGAPADSDESVIFRKRLADYVQGYYTRAQHIVSLERVVMQPLDHSLAPDGRPRRLEYELRVEWVPRADGTPGDATVHRQLLKIDGRTPKPSEEPGCMDPRAVSPEPLA